ncbi:MAG: acetyl-CoA carboxylase biotin carboxyl carrier protein [Verrucomicrobia bacterium]|nr:acetyl-CoA carboxylase biotin carboxyl carrier protein [Verrucomicrobiota bacterium]
MEVKQINQLMLAMGRTGIKKLSFKKDGVELHLEREERSPLRHFDGSLDALEDNPMRSEIEKHRFAGVMAPAEGEAKRVSEKGHDEEKEDIVSLYITSPMVGTVYHAPSPNDPPFIKPGDHVTKDTVVCVVEAMKVMNEVKAGVSGIVSAVLVENGSPVEFGSKLFRITPN